MSSNLGFVLSMIIVAFTLFLGGDMVCLSTAYSALDNVSNTIGYRIAKDARCDSTYLRTLENQYNITFSYISSYGPSIGQVVDFTIYRMYNPLVMSKNDIKMSVSKSTVVGYYG